MLSIIESPDYDEQGLIDDELRSVRTLLTNTTNMMSSKYKRRTRGQPKAIKGKQEEEKGKNGNEHFSAQFVSQWEKNDSWKYINIWQLIKNGVPDELRVNLYKDLLRRQINEHQAHKLIQSRSENHLYNEKISVYENIK